VAYQERVLILNEAEQEDFYGNPSFTSNDQRYFSKAAEILHLFIDDKIDEQQPFGAIDECPVVQG